MDSTTIPRDPFIEAFKTLDNGFTHDETRQAVPDSVLDDFHPARPGEMPPWAPTEMELGLFRPDSASDTSGCKERYHQNIIRKELHNVCDAIAKIEQMEADQVILSGGGEISLFRECRARLGRLEQRRLHTQNELVPQSTTERTEPPYSIHQLMVRLDVFDTVLREVMQWYTCEEFLKETSRAPSLAILQGLSPQSKIFWAYGIARWFHDYDYEWEKITKMINPDKLFRKLAAEEDLKKQGYHV